MAAEIHAPDLGRMSKRIMKAAAELDNDLSKAAESALKDLQPEIKASALEVLPRRGGLAADVARTALPVKRLRKGAQLKALSKSNIRLMNRGKLRHPVYADKTKPRDEWKWVTQTVIRGWFDRPTKAATPEINAAMRKAMERFVQKLR